MDRAEAQKALQACIADEQTYQFTSFSHRDAWELGHALVDACEKMGAPLAVEIEINHVIVFRYYPDGTGAYHEQWLRRKRNLVNLLEKSSQRAYYELEASHADQEHDWHLPRSDYAACSGAFPIRIRDGSVIGVARPGRRIGYAKTLLVMRRDVRHEVIWCGKASCRKRM